LHTGCTISKVTPEEKVEHNLFADEVVLYWV